MTKDSITPEVLKNNLQLALTLAGLGWLVFPCREKPGEPYTDKKTGELVTPDKKTPYIGKGFKAATCDLDQIRAWWKRWPGALIGIYCEGSGFFAVDIDVKNNVDGMTTWSMLVAESGETINYGPCQTTPSGGRHYLFKLPSGVKVPNNASKLGDGLDLRSNGYICTGSGYIWLDGFGPEKPLTDAFGLLVNKVRNLTEKTTAKPQAPRPAAPLNTEQTDPGTHFLNKYLAEAQPGNRNHAGFLLAAQLRDSGLTEGAARPIMCQYAASVPGSDYTEAEALASLASAYSGSPRQPATLPGAGHPTNPDPEPPEVPWKEDLLTERPTTAPVDQDYLPLAVVKDALERQESGDAELLANLYSDLILYDHSESGWYLWAGHGWETDKSGLVYSFVSNGVAPQFLHAAAEVQKAGDGTASKQLAARAAALRNRRRAENVLFLAARTPALALSGDEWDKNPWLLACENGVIDLQTGAFRPGEPGDFIRTHSPTQWEDLLAPCPRFENFMLEIFGGKVDLVNFMQRLLGYGITGLTNEHILPILHGAEGRNGKGTLLETLADVMGPDLAISSQADAIMESGKAGDGPKPFVYALRGKRLVWASESNEGRRINAGLVKQLTGGDRLNVRTLHSKPVEFMPSHLLMLLTNHKPHIPADDQAIWDRVCLIPFEVRFVENPTGKNELQRDKNLREKLKAEAPGILAWLVRGCLEWQKNGLQPPAIVKSANESYRDEEDLISQFLSDCCKIAAGERVKGSDLYQAYSAWCKGNGIEHPMNNISFGRRMSKKFENTHSMGTLYLGLGLFAKNQEG